MQKRVCTNYEQASQLLGKRESLNIANNTRLERMDKDRIFLILYGAAIVTYKPDTIILDSGEWRTVTTKARMNEYTPEWLSVWQRSGKWFVSISGVDCDYHDQFTVRNV